MADDLRHGHKEEAQAMQQATITSQGTPLGATERALTAGIDSRRLGYKLTFAQLLTWPFEVSILPSLQANVGTVQLHTHIVGLWSWWLVQPQSLPMTSIIILWDSSQFS